MKKIKMIRVNAKLNVHGIFNFNDNINNHKHAKKFTLVKGEGDDKRKEVVDYTSSNCLRHLIFLDEMEAQPTDTVRANMLERVAGSAGGILRGYMALNVSSSLKRTSPLFVSDATSEHSLVQTTFNLTNKNLDVNEKETTKIFTSDSAPYRKQTYSIGINIKNLRFLRQDRVWTNSVAPNPKSEDLWISELKKTFRELGCDDEVVIKNNHIDANDICPSPVRGILLNNEQTRALVKVALAKSLSINAMKAKASVETDQESITATVIFEDGSSRSYSSYEDLVKDIEDAQFQDFYSECENAPTDEELDEMRKKLEENAKSKKEERAREKAEKASKKKKVA